MSDPQLPHIRATAVDANGQLTPAFYQALSGAVASLRTQIATVTAVVDALTDGTGDLQALGPLLASKQNASADLDAIAAIIGAGMVSRSALGDWATRELTGTAGRVTVANPDGVAGNPTLDLATVADAGGGTLQKTAFDTYGRKTGASAATTTDLPEGTNLYHTAARVLATVLTGLSTATNAVITAADSVLGALGKLQAQVSGILANYVTTARTISTTAPLTGGGDLSANRVLGIDAATTLAPGSMSAADKSKLDGVAAGATAYTDAMARTAAVADTITDAVTTIAPSQNAVFDALALKAPLASPNFTGPVDILHGSGTGLGLKLGSVTTDATTKDTRILLRHYTAAEEDIAMFGAASGAAGTDLRYGGGFGLQNAATSLLFYTAATPTTLGGTMRWEIRETGHLRPGADNAYDIGTAALRVANTYSRAVYIGAGTAFITSGTGTPEGVVVAPVGSLFTRTDGGAGTTLYVKQSGAGNTGWIGK